MSRRLTLLLVAGLVLALATPATYARSSRWRPPPRGHARAHHPSHPRPPPTVAQLEAQLQKKYEEIDQIKLELARRQSNGGGSAPSQISYP